MYLKAINLKGFKSFPDRTRLTFSPGVSVIVGPNGSGKSNITDAVLWATGRAEPLGGPRPSDARRDLRRRQRPVAAPLRRGRGGDRQLRGPRRERVLRDLDLAADRAQRRRRVPAERRPLPPHGRRRGPLRHEHGPRGPLGDQPGQGRGDRQLEAPGPAPADRGGGRARQAPQAPPQRPAQAGPHARQPRAGDGRGAGGPLAPPAAEAAGRGGRAHRQAPAPVERASRAGSSPTTSAPSRSSSPPPRRSSPRCERPGTRSRSASRRSARGGPRSRSGSRPGRRAAGARARSWPRPARRPSVSAPAPSPWIWPSAICAAPSASGSCASTRSTRSPTRPPARRASPSSRPSSPSSARTPRRRASACAARPGRPSSAGSPPRPRSSRSSGPRRRSRAALRRATQMHEMARAEAQKASERRPPWPVSSPRSRRNSPAAAVEGEHEALAGMLEAGSGLERAVSAVLGERLRASIVGSVGEGRERLAGAEGAARALISSGPANPTSSSPKDGARRLLDLIEARGEAASDHRAPARRCLAGGRPRRDRRGLQPASR